MIRTEGGDGVACPYGGPVVTLDELDALDQAEIIEGYWDGYDNGPRPSGNRSKAYWHGWRNGMVDGKHAEPDPAQRAQVRAVIARDRARAALKATPPQGDAT